MRFRSRWSPPGRRCSGPRASPRPAPPRRAKGGTPRLASFEDVGFVDTALGYGPIPFAISVATCAKLYSHPDEPGAAGTRVIPEVVDRYAVSNGRRTYTFA